MGRACSRFFGLLLALQLVAALPAATQNYEFIERRLDENRYGYDVLHVWGSHYEMGYGMGVALAEDIVTLWQEVQADYGDLLPLGRSLTERTTWLPTEIEDELQGIVDGVRAQIPGAELDVLDLKVLNILSSDLAYYHGCRAHACWGEFVAAPVKLLASRRLDFQTPFPSAHHHVLCAWDPDDGSPRWVNLGWPGMVTAVTAVNAHGTQVSTHDFGSAEMAEGVVPRVVATRHVLTGMGDRPPAEHLQWARGELDAMEVATSSFLNYFAPAGQAGVFTCGEGGPCGQLRRPQDDYFGGQVIITTNSQTDGHQVPGGGQFMHDYYAAGGPKDLDSHFALMGTSGLHLMTVAYRGPEDMTLRIHGRGAGEPLEIEWSALFSGRPGDGDGGTDDDPGGGKSGCATAGAGGAAMLGWLLLLGLSLRRRC